MRGAGLVPKVRSMNCERRSEPRERVKLPVSLSGGHTGLTRDVSAGGLYFEFRGRLETGNPIDLSIALYGNDRPIRLKAQGLVVRVESEGMRCGVGVRLLVSTLERAGND
jgi:hypothetical protein